jgi:hypothetical protein
MASVVNISRHCDRDSFPLQLANPAFSFDTDPQNADNVVDHKTWDAVGRLPALLPSFRAQLKNTVRSGARVIGIGT